MVGIPFVHGGEDVKALANPKKKSLARDTFAARRFPWDVRWGQDGPQSALLGLTDNGGTGMTTLGLMLMQYDGRSIELLPAWPSDWSADFKLHAPYRTTVEGHVENGKIVRLKVTPQSRAKDVVIVAGKTSGCDAVIDQDRATHDHFTRLSIFRHRTEAIIFIPTQPASGP